MEKPDACEPNVALNMEKPDVNVPPAASNPDKRDIYDPTAILVAEKSEIATSTLEKPEVDVPAVISAEGNQEEIVLELLDVKVSYSFNGAPKK